MNISYKPKSKGYMPIHRSIQKLLNDPSFNFSTIGAYICFSFQADWDKRHEHYRAILPNDNLLAQEWGCDQSTISRNKKKLIDLGLLEINKDGAICVKNLDMFNIHTIKAFKKVEHVNLHNYYAKSENELADMLLNNAKSQDFEPEI